MSCPVGAARTIPSRMPEGWEPPVPAYSAELTVPAVVAYYGVQAASGRDAAGVREFRGWIASLRDAPDAADADTEGAARSVSAVSPDVWEYAEFTDREGAYTWIAMLTWRGNPERYTEWAAQPTVRDYWESAARESGPVGVFREVIFPPAQRMETIYSQPGLQAGIATGCPAHQGPIRTHNYWGAMRDRIELSATDALDPRAADSGPTPSMEADTGTRVRLRGHENLAVIHSGQVTAGLEGEELAFYERRLEPALAGGMRYLRDHPVESGCFSCRYLAETDASGELIGRTFGLAHFNSLWQLEDWAEHHPSHLKIFGEFMEMVKQLPGDPTLPLWHQVFVLQADQQLFEYVNCHAGTGLMGVLGSRVGA